MSKYRIEELEIAKLDMQPGDTLIIKVGKHVPQEDYESIVAGFSSALPCDISAIIIPHFVELSIVQQADQDVLKGNLLKGLQAGAA